MDKAKLSTIEFNCTIDEILYMIVLTDQEDQAAEITVLQEQA